jgi:hypothetical protein
MALNPILIAAWVRARPAVQVFASYCTTFDSDLLGDLRQRARDHGTSVHLVASAGEKEAFTDWESSTRTMIGRAEVLLVILGTLMDSGITDEVRIARSLGRPVVALAEDPDDPRLRRLLPDYTALWNDPDLFGTIARFVSSTRKPA